MAPVAPRQALRSKVSARAAWTKSPFRGFLPAPLPVPGAGASWCEPHAAHGRLPLARNLAAAAGYAREGFPVTERLANWIAATAPELARDREAAAIFLKSGQAPRTGLGLVNADLARLIDRK